MIELDKNNSFDALCLIGVITLFSKIFKQLFTLFNSLNVNIEVFFKVFKALLFDKELSLLYLLFLGDKLFYYNLILIKFFIFLHNLKLILFPFFIL